MGIVWLVFAIELVVAYPFYLLTQSQVIQAVVIGVNLFALLLFCFSQKRSVMAPMLLAVVSRFGMMLLDHFTGYMFGGDNVGYYNSALKWAEGPQGDIYGWMYSRLLGYIFRFCGGSRMLSGYVNILLFMTALWMLYRSICLLKMDDKLRERLVWLMALFPYSVIFSVGTNRESVIVAFMALSVYFALRWYLDMPGRTRNMVLSCACLLFAATFHAGVILVGIGYAMMFIFYSQKADRFIMNRRTIPVFLLAMALLAIVVMFPSLFMAKFYNSSTGKFVEADRLLGAKEYYNLAGSAYLTWINASSMWQLALYTPLKMFYFVFSPLPTDWRGIVDAMTFLLDSVVYAGAIWYILRHYKTSGMKRFILAMTIGLLISVAAFSWGTYTAGTAIRHRNKMFSCLLVMCAAASVPAKERAEVPAGAMNKIRAERET